MLRVELNEIFLDKVEMVGVKNIFKGNGFLGGGILFIEFFDGVRYQIELVSNRITDTGTDVPRTFLSKERLSEIPINVKKDTQPAFNLTSDDKTKKVITKQKNKTKCKKK